MEAAREQLFVSLQNQAQARRNSGQVGQRTESLAALAEAARIRPDPKLRDNAIAAMAIPDVQMGPAWPNPGGVIGPFDATFQRYARFNADGTVSIRTIPNNQELQLLHFTPGTSSDYAGFSADGRFFANVRDSRLLVWRCESGESVFKSPPENCSTFAFSPDSRQLAIAQETSITCFNPNTGEAIRRWPMRGRPFAMDFDPASRRLAVGYRGSNLVSIYNADTGAEEATLPIGADSGSSVAWHPDGELLATGGSDGRIQLWAVRTHQRVGVLEGHVEHVTSLSFHPGGELLASTSWDAVTRLWQPSPGRLLMRLSFSGCIRFNSANQWAGVIASADDQLRHFEVVTGGEYRTFLNHFASGAKEIREGDISPDGALLAVGGSDGVRLWDIACGREVARLRMADTTQALFSSSGRELFTCGPFDGLQRWSIEPDTGPESGLKITGQHRVSLPFEPVRMARGSNDHLLAVVGERAGQSVLLDLNTEMALGPAMPHSGVAFVALTSNAERLATSGWHSKHLKVWEGQTGKLLSDMETGNLTGVFFTPDDQEMIVARATSFIFYDVHSFKVNRVLQREVGLYPGYVAFTADGKLMALEMAPGVIHLKEIISGRTVARLEDPYGDRSTWMSFTPDGTQLVVVARYASAIHRWDLRAIRARLKTMNLDWDWPEFPALPPGDAVVAQSRRPLRVQVAHPGPTALTQEPATNAPAGKP